MFDFHYLINESYNETVIVVFLGQYDDLTTLILHITLLGSVNPVLLAMLNHVIDL